MNKEQKIFEEKFEKMFTEKNVTIDVDWYDDGSGADKKMAKKYGIKIKTKDGTADISGDTKKIIKYLTTDYQMDMDDVKEIYPELF